MKQILKVEKIEEIPIMEPTGYPLIVTSYGDQIKFRFIFLAHDRCILLLSPMVNNLSMSVIEEITDRVKKAFLDLKIMSMFAVTSGGWTIDNVLQAKPEAQESADAALAKLIEFATNAAKGPDDDKAAN